MFFWRIIFSFSIWKWYLCGPKSILQPCGLSPARLHCLGFSRQEHWREQPFPPPGDLPNPAIEPRRHHFVDRGLYSQSYGFSSSPAGIWELDHKEGWAPKSWCFQTVVLEKTLESPLDCKEIKPIVRKINIHWKDWCWSWNSDTLVTRFEELTHWKSLQCWKRLKAKGETSRGWNC